MAHQIQNPADSQQAANEEKLLAKYDSFKDGQPEPMSRARAWMVTLSDEDFDTVCRGLNARVHAR